MALYSRSVLALMIHGLNLPFTHRYFPRLLNKHPDLLVRQTVLSSQFTTFRVSLEMFFLGLTTSSRPGGPRLLNHSYNGAVMPRVLVSHTPPSQDNPTHRIPTISHNIATAAILRNIISLLINALIPVGSVRGSLIFKAHRSVVSGRICRAGGQHGAFARAKPLGGF